MAVDHLACSALTDAASTWPRERISAFVKSCRAFSLGSIGTVTLGGYVLSRQICADAGAHKPTGG
jgi:hypothetical protein